MCIRPLLGASKAASSVELRDRYCLTNFVGVSKFKDDEMGRACGAELYSEFLWGKLRAVVNGV